MAIVVSGDKKSGGVSVKRTFEEREQRRRSRSFRKMERDLFLHQQEIEQLKSRILILEKQMRELRG